MQATQSLKLLFVINNKSGSNKIDWRNIIETYFDSTEHDIHLYELPEKCEITTIQEHIRKIMPDRIAAVGGDGTVKLVAECVIDESIPIAIIPGGSANGMAKEFGISDNLEEALDNVVSGVVKNIHLVKVNDELCIHLCDMGFNAFMIKKFESLEERGKWGYAKAFWSCFWQRKTMMVEVKVNGKNEIKKAVMIVIANATKYGTGALINPKGKLDDELFEIIIIKRFSLREIFKMMVTHKPYDPEKTEILQCNFVHINSKSKVHFQVDGEYLGKINDVKASVIKDAIEVVIPA